ncbi:hypothetical protein MRX96_053503, partial [Rhipicephalus microplus]
MTQDTQADEKVVEGGLQKGDVPSTAGSKATADGPAKPGDLELAHPATFENPKATAFTSLPGSSETSCFIFKRISLRQEHLLTRARGRERFCTTKGCEEHKRRIEGQLDKSVDPCDDFGAHVCGGWASRKEFLLSRSQMTDMHLAWLYKLPTTLEAGVARLPVGMKVDAMFKSCMTPGKSQAIHGSKCYYLASCVGVRWIV